MRPSSPRSSPEQGYCHGQNQRPNSTTGVPARRVGFMLSPLSVTLDGQSLGPADVVAVARHGDRVSLGPQAKTRLERARALVDRLVAEDRVVYGLTTGVGALKNVRIPPADTRQLQRNLFMSHAVGVGPPLPDELVRAGMLVRVNQFCQGTSGVVPAVAQQLIDLLNHDICPWVPEKGSLGASGDLAPSAHVGLVLIGEGDVVHKGERRSGAEALRAASLQPVELRAKDALSVLNGTHFMTGAASLVLHDARRLLLTADVVAALSVEALRCAAQVHGACHDAIDYLGRVLAVELNAGTDNPLVFAEDEAVLSGGNFHGEPLALALDTASIGLSELGSISERRLFRMLTGFLSELPPFLTRHSGLDSGYMLLQYTAAALATDNQLLATPASVHSLPTSADQEDHNSMGWHSAQRARQVATNVEAILALEALGAAQGIDLLAPLKPGRLTGEAHAAIREKVPTLDHDRVLEPEIEAAIELVRSGRLAGIAR